MLSRERRHVHTVGVRLRNEEGRGGREERPAETRARGGGDPVVFSAPLSSPSLQRERPTKRIVSLCFRTSCPQGGGSSLEMVSKLCAPPTPGVLPGGVSGPAPHATLGGGAPPCHSPPQVRSRPTQPTGGGAKINATFEAKWRCPAGPQGPALMPCHLTPLPAPGKSPEWAT